VTDTPSFPMIAKKREAQPSSNLQEDFPRHGLISLSVDSPSSYSLNSYVAVSQDLRQAYVWYHFFVRASAVELMTEYWAFPIVRVRVSTILMLPHLQNIFPREDGSPGGSASINTKMFG
jgi:hypothetical protein